MFIKEQCARTPLTRCVDRVDVARPIQRERGRREYVSVERGCRIVRGGVHAAADWRRLLDSIYAVRDKNVSIAVHGHTGHSVVGTAPVDRASSAVTLGGGVLIHLVIARYVHVAGRIRRNAYGCAADDVRWGRVAAA